MTDRRGSLSAPAKLRTDAPLPAVAAVTSNRSLAVALGAVLVTAVVFALWPDLDLAAARMFYSGQGHFVAQRPVGRGLRWVFSIAPFAVLGLMLMLYLARRAGRALRWAPSGREIAFLVVTLALGPGLLVNTGLKDHSHRPRPVQVQQFGGTLTFRPLGTFDGACTRNCSFVSGEGSAAFWTATASLLLPAATQLPALAAALVLGVAAGVLRMAFGGHFLSDTIFAALFTWLVIIGAWRAMFRPPKPIFNHVATNSR